MQKTTLIVAIIALVVGVSALFFALPGGTKAVGAEYQTLFQNFAAGLSIGDPGSQVSPRASKLTFVKAGTCNSTFSGTSLAATSTGLFYCSNILGVKAGDIVQATLPSTARTGANQWFEIIDGYATTTDRFGFDMANFSGAATSSFRQATTGIQYEVYRTSTNP